MKKYFLIALSLTVALNAQVNEDKFKTLSSARKFMAKLQRDAKKEGRKVEVIKVDRYNYRVILEKDAEEEYSKLDYSK